MAKHWCRTFADVSTLTHIWTIENYTFACLEIANIYPELIGSSQFWSDDNPGVKWALSLDPGVRMDERYRRIFKELITETSNLTAYYETETVETYVDIILAKFRVVLEKENGEIILDLDCGVKAFDHDETETVAKFEGKGLLYDVSEADGVTSLLPNDVLVIRCHIQVMTGNLENLNGKRLKTQHENRRPLEDVMIDILDSGYKVDVTFVVGEQEFRGHQLILAARSPVFRAMFEHEMGNKGRVEIIGIQARIFRELLRFVYSGKLPGDVIQDCRTLCELTVAADRYDLRDLRDRCEYLLVTKNLTVPKVPEILESLVLVPEAKYLYDMVDGFIKRNKSAVVATEGWKNLLLSQNALVQEAISKLSPY